MDVFATFRPIEAENVEAFCLQKLFVDPFDLGLDLTMVYFSIVEQVANVFFCEKPLIV